MTSDATSQPNVSGLRFPPRFWAAVLLGGVAAGVAGGALMLLLHAVGRVAWGAGPMVRAYTAAGPGRKLLALTTAGVWVGVAGWIVRRRFGRAGDLEGAIWHGQGRVPAGATLAGAVVSIVAVGLGMSLGREAAVKQAGGALASGLSDRLGLAPEHRRLLVAFAVGAGMAAAYNVPLGGALFAVEVLVGTASLPLVLPALAMSVAAVVTSWAVLPTTPVYAVHDHPLTRSAVVWAAACGPVFGVVAVAVVRAVAITGRSRPGGAAGIVLPVVALAALGAVAIPFPQLLGNGMEAVQQAFDGVLSVPLLAAVTPLKLVATAACLAAGARGGLLTPTMAIGATAGGLLAHAAPAGVDPGLAAMIGSAAVLAAATQGPVSSVVLLMELTRHGDATMVPLLIAVLGATFVANRLDGRSIYSARSGRGPSGTGPEGAPQGPACLVRMG